MVKATLLRQKDQLGEGDYTVIIKGGGSVGERGRR